MAKKKFKSDKAFTAKKFSNSLLYIFKGAKQFPVSFWLTVFFQTIEAILFSVFTVIVKSLIECVTSPEANATSKFLVWDLNWIGWIILSCSGIIILFFIDFCVNIFSGVFSKKLEIYFRNLCLESLVKQDMSYYFNNQLGLIMTRVISDTAGVGEGFNNFFVGTIYFVVNMISTTIIMFNINVQISGYAFLFFFVVSILLWFTFVLYRRNIIRAIDYKQKADADLIDRIMNIRIIKANATENYEAKRTKKVNSKYDKKLGNVVKLYGLIIVFNGAFAAMIPGFVVIVSTLVYGSETGSHINIIIPLISGSYALVSACSYLPQTLRGATKLSNCVMRIGYIIDPIPLIDRNVENDKKINSLEKIEFKKVQFSYPDQPENMILPEITYNFEKGKSYAFVGETGVGKSTIAKLMLRFYDPTIGDIFINNKNLKEINLSDYLSHVGYVEQDPQILYGTVMENLKYPLLEKTDEEAMEAAKKAKLHDFIMGLPEKYDSILGERGFILSGGQKQRLIISRLFLKNPDLLILDEATSALDNIVETEIQQELDELMKNRTTIAIAHKLSTIKNVDNIIVLDKNLGIAQIGNFETLKKIKGRFQDLYNAGIMK